MAAVVGQEHGVVGSHMDAVRPRILTLAPGSQKVALAIEDDHRVFTAVEDINIIVAVDADPANLLKGPAVE
jgi:hypothetical protein